MTRGSGEPEPDHGRLSAAQIDGDSALLRVENLEVTFGRTPSGMPIRGVHDVSYSVAPGETLGVVGESGSGKSVTVRAVLGLLPKAGRLTSGSVYWRGARLDNRARAKLRGRKIAMVFQDSMAALNPLMKVGEQVTEVLTKHQGMRRRQARRRTLELFDRVSIPRPESVLSKYPWELSGGMAQRVVIAMALAPEPEIIVADEPTTALDVTVQAEVLGLLQQVQQDLGLAMIFITHDLGVVAHLAHRIVVMYAGRVVETGETGELFRAPSHPYTDGLLRSTPNPEQRGELRGIPGNAPLALTPMAGCAFAPRCPHATEQCELRPPLTGSEAAPTGAIPHLRACWHPLNGGER